MARPTGPAGRESRRQREARLRARAEATRVPARCDVCVIGCGAAGIVAAAVASEAGASVVALERSDEVARTLLATGNGRCNFANEALDPTRYNDPGFVTPLMDDGALGRILDWFASCGLAWVSHGGLLYPRSLAASSVRDVLLARAERSGAVLAPLREATAIEPGASAAGSTRDYLVH